MSDPELNISNWQFPTRQPNFCPNCGGPLTEGQIIDGMLRPICAAACGYVFWDHPVPIVAAIVEHDNSNIILVRSHGWPEKFFGLVSGFLEAGELPETWILREIKEELGLDGSISSFVGHYLFEQMNQLILVFHVKASGKIVQGDELAAFKSIPFDQLKPWPFGAGPAIQDWLQKTK